MLIKLEINIKNIEKNLEKIKSINKNIICVLKDNAYGLEIKNILPILIENDCFYFAVAYIGEALEIKKIIQKKYPDKADKIKIMTLNYIEEKEIKKTVKNDIELTILNFEQLESYINASAKGKKLKIHIKLNTGMNRLGFNENEIDKLTEILRGNPNLEIISVFSHISHAENKKETEEQIIKYDKMMSVFDKNSIKYKFKHIQASPLLFKYKEKYNYDFVRTGMAIYGMEPLKEKVGLYNTVKLSSKIINIRKVKKGESVSYGNGEPLEKDGKIAIIPVGYAHGLQKQIENKNAYVLIKGKRSYILGEICMDMIITDITDIEDAVIGSEAVIIGKQGSEEISLSKMAEWTGTIQDDVLTKWERKIKRSVANLPKN